MDIDKIKKRNYPNKNGKSNIDIPEDKWIKCPKCKEIIYKSTYNKAMFVCPYCSYYFKMGAYQRMQSIVDENTFKEFDLKIKGVNPLGLESYPKKLQEAREKTGLDEAALCGSAKIYGENIVLCILDANFMMGSMGSVVGEKITYSIEQACEKEIPLIIFSASGGARMQEGIISLMQMAKTTSALTKLAEKKVLYISVLTDPTYGGVTASFASLGDIILAEPGAMIGFAGQSVIKNTIGENLPEGFQTSEFLLEHGFIDKIVERKEMKKVLYDLLMYHKKGIL